MGVVLFRLSDYANAVLENRSTWGNPKTAFSAEFGWPCGGTFIPNRAKCWTDPKTGRKLKRPLTYQVYQKIQGSKGRAAQTLYKDREQAIRDRRRAAVPGWKKQEHIRDVSKLSPKITQQDEELLRNSPLKGTDKQVAWAEQLRRTALIDAKKEAILYAELYTKNNPNGEKLSNKDYGEVEKLLAQYVASKKDAKHWIDNRYANNQEDIVRSGMREYVRRLAASNDPRLPDEIKERALKGVAYEQDRKNKASEIDKSYKELKLPRLDGTERQIKYAQDLQQKTLEQAKKKGIAAADIQMALEKSPAMSSAKWWIENKSVDDVERVIGKVKEKRTKPVTSKPELPLDPGYERLNQGEPVELKKGDRVKGVYMGLPFSGTVAGIRESQSGYAIDKNTRDIDIKVDDDLTDETGWKRREKGESVMISAGMQDGKYKLEDSKFESLSKQIDTSQVPVKKESEQTPTDELVKQFPGWMQERQSYTDLINAKKGAVIPIPGMMGEGEVQRINAPNKTNPYGSVTVRPTESSKAKYKESGFDAPNQETFDLVQVHDNLKKTGQPDKQKLESELKQVQEQIASDYWRFSRSSSPNVKPPSKELYDREKELKKSLGKKDLWERTQQEVKGQMNAEAHQKQVERALEQGAIVPDEVLKDYPELKQKYGRSPATENSTQSKSRERNLWQSKLKDLDNPKELTVGQYEDKLKDYLPPAVYREYEQISTERDRLSRAVSSATKKKDKETAQKAFDDFNKGKYADIWAKVNHGAAKQGYPDLQSDYPELGEKFGKANKPALNLDGNYSEPVQPKETKKAIASQDVKNLDDREALAKQELAEAKKSGDQSRIKSWEEEAKRARMAKLKAEQKSQQVQQGTLFNPLVYDKDLQGGLPLFKKRIKRRAEFEGRREETHAKFSPAPLPPCPPALFSRPGWQCGKTFIPYNRKCYTDPKTGLKLKTPLTYQQYNKRRAEVYRNAQRGILPDNEGDRLMLQSVSDQQAKLKTQKEKLRLTQAAASVGARQVLPSGIAEVEVSRLKVDPKRFQYKILGASTSSGSVGSLSGVRTWDANLAGIIQVWQDPKDKQVYVVNGHNRTERAKALGVKTMTAKFIKAKSAQEARSIGALTNVSEGRGTALDAAKFFRDSGMTRQDLERKGIPMREKIATDGLALSNLSEPLFNRVVQGSLPEQRAVTIGQSLKDHKQQQELVDLIEKEEKRGKKINNDVIQELTDMVVGAPKVEQSQGGLFDLLGFTPETRSLALEKAQVQASIKRQLAREKKLFGTVGKSRAAEDLAKAGNQINVEESAEISDTAAKALDAFDKEKNLSGDVSSAINRAAERIANGENPKKVEKEIYDEVLTNLQKTYRFGERSGTNIAKRRIGSDRLAASRQVKNAEFNEGRGQEAEGRRLKRRIKRRKKSCCCQHKTLQELGRVG